MWPQIIGTAVSALAGSKTGSSASSGPPKWLRKESKSVLDRARPYYQTPYERYTGPRVIGLSPMEQRANRMADDNVGKYQPWLDKAAALADRSSRMLEGYDLSGYINPYKEKVLDLSARKAGERGQMGLNRLAGQAASRNAFGNRRTDILMNDLRESVGENIDNIYTTGMSDAYDRATSNFFRDNDEMRAGQRGYLDLIRSGLGMDANDLANLYRGGGLERQVDQTQADTDYADWLEKRDWDKTQVERYIQQILRGLPVAQVQSGSSSPLAGALGGAMQGYALSDRLFGGDNNTGTTPNSSGMYGSAPISVAGGTFDANNLPPGYNPIGG
jgi:hypothetical protein